MADQYAGAGAAVRPPAIQVPRWEEPPEGPVVASLDRTHVPFVAVATSVDPDTAQGALIERGQRPAREVTDLTAAIGGREGAVPGGDTATAPLRGQAYDLAFHVTPPELASGLVTDDGGLTPVSADGMTRLCDRSRWGNGMMSL